MDFNKTLTGKIAGAILAKQKEEAASKSTAGLATAIVAARTQLSEERDKLHTLLYKPTKEPLKPTPLPGTLETFEPEPLPYIPEKPELEWPDWLEPDSITRPVVTKDTFAEYIKTETSCANFWGFSNGPAAKRSFPISTPMRRIYRLMNCSPANKSLKRVKRIALRRLLPD